MKFGMYIMAPESISTAYLINPISLCVCICIRLMLIGNGSVNSLPRQRLHAATEEMLDASFSIWSVLYQRRVYGSVCVSSILVYAPQKRWSEDSQSRQTVKYGNDSRGPPNQESLCSQAPAAIFWAGLNCVSPHCC
jgi:hypothetical protein